MATYLSSAEADRLRQSFSAWMLIEPYLSNLRIGNRSSQTIAEYRKTLHNFCLEVSCSLDVSHVELRDWIASMHDRSLKASTIASRMTTMRSFFKFAIGEGLLDTNPVDRLPRIKVGRRLPKALSPDEIRAFFEAIRAQPNPERRDRDLLLFHLTYTCGFRVGEVTTLRIENVNLAAGTIRVVGKGDKERTVPIRPELTDDLAAWIAGRRRGWLFTGQDGTHLSSRTVQPHCREYGKAAGLTSVHPHKLRHSCATHYLSGGAHLAFIQALLGHANLGTTGIYTQLVDEERARIAREVPLAL